MIATLAAPGSALLGEAPRWMRLGGSEPALHFADLLAGTVQRLVDDRAEVVLDFPGETVSALLPLRGGGAAVALHRALAVLDETGGLVDRRELDLPLGTRLSDATAGPSGHLWIGVVPAGDDPVPGALLRLGADGIRVMREGIGFSNGVGFTADGSRLLHIDSSTGIVWASPHDPETGDLGSPEALFRHTGAGTLDGLCLDAHDRAWVAVFGGGGVLCLDRDGAVVDRVEVPAARVSSCVIAGTTLYITTARVDAPADELAAFPLAGSLFRCDLGVAGGPIWEGHSA